MRSRKPFRILTKIKMKNQRVLFLLLALVASFSMIFFLQFCTLGSNSKICWNFGFGSAHANFGPMGRGRGRGGVGLQIESEKLDNRLHGSFNHAVDLIQGRPRGLFMSKLRQQQARLIRMNYDYMMHPNHIQETEFHFDAIQQVRRDVVGKVCAMVANDSLVPRQPIPDHLLVDDNHRLIFCQVRKVASITWRKILDEAAMKMNGAKIRRLRSYTDAERIYRLQNYKKVMFVREPILRAVSGWYDKFVNGVVEERLKYLGLYGCDIVRRMNANMTSIKLCRHRYHHDIDDSYDEMKIDLGINGSLDVKVPFHEFARYLISGPTAIRNDMHWESCFSRCQPCQVQYDFIGHYETMEPDTYEIMRRLGLGDAASNFSFRSSTSANIARAVIRGLESRLIFKLYQLYHLDYELFGYNHFKLQEWANQVPIKKIDYDPFIVEIGRPKQ